MDHQAPFVPSVEVLVKALIVISSAAVTGPPSSWTVQAIFCSHHPSVVGTGTREDVWKRLQKCLKTRESVCQSLLGPMGLMSPKTPEQQAAIFQTPEGMILNEQAIYVAQTIGAKYTNQEPAREAANSGRRDTAKLAKKADKGKTVKEEAQELMLKEEMPLRRWVLLIMCFVTASYLFERIIHSQWLNQQMIYGHDLPAVMTLLISRALADPKTYVRGKMINAGIMIIHKHGKENASDEEEYDLVREGVVIFTGSLAKHLAKDDPKVHNVVENLLEVLKTIRLCATSSLNMPFSTCAIKARGGGPCPFF
ncbi:unnamed protein product [Arabidopsis lyrata]|nr:unnamed protein product [Arabidopsis lyrata]